MKIKNEIKKQLENYKNLSKYAFHFEKQPYEPEHPGHLNNLIIWFRETLDNAGVDDVASYFGWDDETAEDFYTWGHNSRWAHTFYSYLINNINDALEIALDLADEFGDVDIDKMYFSQDNKQ